MALGNNGLTTSITQPDVTLNVTVPVVNTNGTVTQGAVTSVVQPQVIVNISDSGILTTVPTGQVVATVEGVYQSVPTATQGFFNRVFDDLVSSTETSFWIEKVLFDNIQLSEQVKLVVAFIRGYSDQLNISDTIKLTTGKYYLDSASASDAGYFKKTTIKSTLETILVTDTKNFSVSKTLTDLLQIVETKRGLIQKPVIDSIRITDLFATVSNYFKNFTELVSPTDDYYGLANIDDDEYATFNKVVNEWLQITQSAPIFQVAKALTETLLSVEAVSKLAAKAIIPDSVSISDSTVNQTVAAGSFVPGQTYVILSTGTTDYTLIGASSNQPGTQFVATGAGTGTGTATQVVQQIANSSSAGSFIPGQTYIIQSTGSTNFTQIGASNNQPGTQFVATGVGTGTGTASQITNAGNFIIGQTYIIQSTGTTDYTLIGASSNQPGIKFVATGVGTGTGTASQTKSVIITITNAGNFVPGQTYIIQSTGTTDYTLIGASSNQPGTQFVATGTGTGSGIAYQATPVSNVFQAISKPKFIELLNINDQKYFAANKQVLETLTLTERIQKAVSIMLMDTSTSSESVNKYLTKLLAPETITLAEYFVYVLARFYEFSEQFTTSDLNNFGIGKTITETLTTADSSFSTISGFNKVYSDFLVIQDTLNRLVNFNLTLTDLVQSTDDYYGLANIDDDQYVTFNKTATSELFTVYDFTSTRLLKGIPNIAEDTVVYSEYITKQTSKNISDLIVSVEYYKATINKRINDTVTNSDIIITNYITAGNQKYLTDLLTVSSSVTINQQNYFASNYVTTGYTGSFTYAT
jgi:hypothetical protein